MTAFSAWFRKDRRHVVAGLAVAPPENDGVVGFDDCEMGQRACERGWWDADAVDAEVSVGWVDDERVEAAARVALENLQLNIKLAIKAFVADELEEIEKGCNSRRMDRRGEADGFEVWAYGGKSRMRFTGWLVLAGFEIADEGIAPLLVELRSEITDLCIA